jgi:TatD DNase family protein
MLYDVHCHLLDKSFNKDREKIIQDCAEKNISVFETGLDYENNMVCLRLSEEYDNVYSCMGLHPSNKFDDRVLNQVRDYKNKIVGVGEVGLDFKYGNKKHQVMVFKKMISLAEELRLPLIVHSRRAGREVIELVEGVKVPIVLHAFTSGKKIVLKALQNRNVLFCVNAGVVYSEQLEWLVENTSINRLLCETDSPYMWKFERNTPLNVKKAYKKIGEVKGLSFERVESLIESNVKRTFKNIGGIN